MFFLLKSVEQSCGGAANMNTNNYMNNDYLNVLSNETDNLVFCEIYIQVVKR